MAPAAQVYDPAVADGRFQREVLALRWLLTALYALFAVTGVIDVTPLWFALSGGFLFLWHLYYTWYTWHELTREPLRVELSYVIPFMDATAVTLTLLAIGDPMHPVWAAYFYIIVAIGFFYYAIARAWLVWLLANYAALGAGLHLHGIDVPVPEMIVAGAILTVGVVNIIAYTGGERRLRRRISKTARTDPLTQLLNRRGLEEVLDEQLLATRQQSLGLALMMVDIDWFKRYNDQYGHIAADSVLEELGAVLSAAMREPDLVGRYGGDEFVVIVPGVTPAEAVQLAERLRQQVARTGLCTVSIGVSVDAGRDGAKAEELLDLADEALLAAKQSGRNCVRAPEAGGRAA